MQQVDSFAFLQSIYSTAFLCYLWPPWRLPSFAAVQRWYRGEGLHVIAPPYIIIVFMKRNSVCACWFFFFSSGIGLHCIGLLKKATLTFAVFCCCATLTWMRRTTGNCRPLLLLFLYSETLFVKIHSFAFLQSKHPTAFLCWPRQPWSYASSAAVQRWYRGEGHIVIAPRYIIVVFI